MNLNFNNKWTRGALPALLIHCSIGSVYAWSLFVNPISNYLGVGQQKVQIAFSLAIFFLGMSSAVFGSFVETNIKRASLLSMIFFVSGLFLTSVSLLFKSLLGVYIGYGFLMGIGLGIGYITPIKNLMLWFSKNKGLGTGIAITGFGFASTIASPMITQLLNHYSLSVTFLIMGVIYFFPMILANIIIKRPKDYVQSTTKSNIKIKQLFKNRTFVCIWIMVFLNISSGLALISVASPIMLESGMSNYNIMKIVAIMGLFNGLGRLLFSALSDKFKHRKNIYYVIFGLSIASCLLAIFNSSLIFITLLIISACYGAGFSNLPSLLSDKFGMENISKIHGISLTAWAIAGLIGNQISALVKDYTNSYIGILFILLTTYSFGVIMNKSIK